MATEFKRIILRRGIGMPANLAEAELGFRTDEPTLYVGTGNNGDVIALAEKTHTHPKSDISDFAHTHPKSDISDFAHTHPKSDISDFAHTHTVEQVLGFNLHSIITLWVGSQTITRSDPVKSITLPFSGLRNCTVLVDWESADFGYGLQTSLVNVTETGLINIFFLGSLPEVWFTLLFTDTQVFFEGYFDGFYAQDYVLKKIRLYLNR